MFKLFWTKWCYACMNANFLVFVYWTDDIMRMDVEMHKILFLYIFFFLDENAWMLFTWEYMKLGFYYYFFECVNSCMKFYMNECMKFYFFIFLSENARDFIFFHFLKENVWMNAPDSICYVWMRIYETLFFFCYESVCISAWDFIFHLCLNENAFTNVSDSMKIHVRTHN